MSTENQQWTVVRQAIKDGGGQATRVENRCGLGTPDVMFGYGNIGGWCELKHVDRYPPRGGPIRLPHYTPKQRAFHVQWDRRGGLCHVLLRVEKDWYVVRGEVAAKHLHHVDKEGLEKVAHAVMYGKLCPVTLRSALRIDF